MPLAFAAGTHVIAIAAPKSQTSVPHVVPFALQSMSFMHEAPAPPSCANAALFQDVRVNATIATAAAIERNFIGSSFFLGEASLHFLCGCPASRDAVAQSRGVIARFVSKKEGELFTIRAPRRPRLRARIDRNDQSNEPRDRRRSSIRTRLSPNVCRCACRPFLCRRAPSLGSDAHITAPALTLAIESSTFSEIGDASDDLAIATTKYFTNVPDR
jgi:hypothetical protein